MDINKVSKVLYHKNCHDGLASAAIFYKINKNIEYYSYQHGDIIPDFRDERILILDLSLPKQKIIDLMKNNIIYIVDHHLPTEELVPIIKPPNFIKYDKSKCGALNLWSLLNPDEPAPLLLKYVNDRDLWLNKLPNYQEMFDGLTLEKKTVNNWYNLLFNSSCDNIIKLIDKGSILRKKINDDLKNLESKSYIRKFNFKDVDFNVVYCNSSLLQSDLGNYLVKKFNVDFAAIYHYNGKRNKTVFSLRGINRINLSEVAQVYGGGGHYNASGCSITGIVDELI